MKVRVEIGTNVPRSLYCGKIYNLQCDYAATKQSIRLNADIFCTLYKTYLGTTKNGMVVKCNECIKSLRKELISGG